MLKWYEIRAWQDFKAHLATHHNEYMPDEKRQQCMAGDIDTMSTLIDRVIRESGDEPKD